MIIFDYLCLFKLENLRSYRICNQIAKSIEIIKNGCHSGADRWIKRCFAGAIRAQNLTGTQRKSACFCGFLRVAQAVKHFVRLDFCIGISDSSEVRVGGQIPRQ